MDIGRWEKNAIQRPQHRKHATVLHCHGRPFSLFCPARPTRCNRPRRRVIFTAGLGNAKESQTDHQPHRRQTETQASADTPSAQVSLVSFQKHDSNPRPHPFQTSQPSSPAQPSPVPPSPVQPRQDNAGAAAAAHCPRHGSPKPPRLPAALVPPPSERRSRRIPPKRGQHLALSSYRTRAHHHRLGTPRRKKRPEIWPMSGASGACTSKNPGQGYMNEMGRGLKGHRQTVSDQQQHRRLAWSSSQWNISPTLLEAPICCAPEICCRSTQAQRAITRDGAVRPAMPLCEDHRHPSWAQTNG